MNSHDLARLLLLLPNLPVAVSAHGHTYSSRGHRESHGPLMIGKSTLGYFRLDGGSTDHIVIGDMLKELRGEIEILHDERKNS